MPVLPAARRAAAANARYQPPPVIDPSARRVGFRNAPKARGMRARLRAVLAAIEGGAGRALRHQREAGVVRTARRAGKAVLWELAE